MMKHLQNLSPQCTFELRPRELTGFAIGSAFCNRCHLWLCKLKAAFYSIVLIDFYSILMRYARKIGLCIALIDDY
ncbi:hypothetical protein DICVIV_03626 [Dictyocaulus viviparus]|uniref:Uncharacterized protein n=1 Tax=Dictyocaulus viviparus TaxID=29172 RepID=A0A0D8Y215_DICVI|nr:hypothetical protein DICVIV_03626 [Dictyocaulus viviparus]